MNFADVLGYSFRKRVALAVEQQSLHHDLVEEHPARGRDARETEIAQRPWAGGGPFDQFRAQCPFDFSAWFLRCNGQKFKVRNAMDVSRLGPAEPYGIPHGVRSETWWRGSVIDIWLKTPMLTFNRAFPHEINRFEPTLCDAGELSRHLRFVSLFDLGDEFSRSYVGGLAPSDHAEGERALIEAKGAEWKR